MNLRPYLPPGWDSQIVISNATTTFSDAAPLLSSQTLYLDWAARNDGPLSIGMPFQTQLYVDGSLKTSWTTSSLNAFGATGAFDYVLGKLSAGTHTVTIKVDSAGTVAESDENDNVFTKTISVTHVSSDATLKDLSLSVGTLSPAFSSSTTAYTANVGHAINWVTLRPTTANGFATVKVNGSLASTPSGESSDPWFLSVGENTLLVVVTAQDGTTTQSYVVKVTRAAYSPAEALDSSFGGNGAVTLLGGPDKEAALAVAIQPDGKVVTAGYSLTGSQEEFLVARYLPNGDLDTTFNRFGPRPGVIATKVGGGTTSSRATCVALQADGKIVAGGLLQERGTSRLRADSTDGLWCAGHHFWQ
ncbi:hypothetical protein AYO49_04500 [Verrucomicrobiaceae bacterium SCGC AG-212-N21]|nr:hypothetical protein AYO49_04500 [Verrucomicrobiaceae bacterium SCGC AG-212-N21]